jgi:hypothetical protein
MARTHTKRLRQFLKDSYLPRPRYTDCRQVPSDVRKHANTINVRPELYRLLCSMASFDRSKLHEAMRACELSFCYPD